MLNEIHGIDDLKKLNVKDLPALCEEIRLRLIDTVTENGGHLASNLGVVELTVALHYVFDAEDKIVWDVGHQSYVHKLLTGRADDFYTLRKKDGISGFPCTEESEEDVFNTGHSGTAISAALGIAAARDIAGGNYNVVAVVGDGAMTGGMTYEALNNIKNTGMLVVLNDNNMSIDKNVGSATLNMSKLRVGKYDRNKEKLKKFLLKIPLLGKPSYRFLRWCKRRAKLGFVKNSYFDNFNLKYIGIIDGNEIKDLIYYLSRIKQNVRKPTVLHIVTKKGKGYEPAERQPEKYHSVGTSEKGLTSASVAGSALCEIGGRGIAAVTAAMTDGVGLKTFAETFPDKFFDVGIAEEHAVTFAAGLAKGGVHPFVLIYSTFLQRAYDQILHDVALQKLPVTFLIDHAGFVGADGRTHQGLQDLSYLSNIPNIRIWTPYTYLQLRQMILASADCRFPVAIRYGKTLSDAPRQFDGKWNVLRKGGKIRILAVGAALCENALNAGSRLDAEVVAVTCVKPLDGDYLSSVENGDIVVTLEENQLNGGFGSAAGAYFADKRKTVKLLSLGVKDVFVAHATVSEQLEMCGLDADGILKSIAEFTEIQQ